MAEGWTIFLFVGGGFREALLGPLFKEALPGVDEDGNNESECGSFLGLAILTMVNRFTLRSQHVSHRRGGGSNIEFEPREQVRSVLHRSLLASALEISGFSRRLR